MPARVVARWVVGSGFQRPVVVLGVKCFFFEAGKSGLVVLGGCLGGFLGGFKASLGFWVLTPKNRAKGAFWVGTPKHSVEKGCF